MKINFIDLKAQYDKYETEIDKEVKEVFSTALFIGGPKIKQLEGRLCEYIGAKHVICCSSGTDALLLALMAFGIKPGEEVITTPFTFIATAEVIALMGAKPVFVDIEEKTYNIDATKIEDSITDETKAIIPVSLYGQCSDMEEINNIAAKYGLPVIEDACQSFGAEYKGKKSCNLSTIGCTSFFPSKPLGAYGDGGAIFTSNDKLAEKMRMLLNHGQNERYKHKYIGINGRLDEVQAAILNVKLSHFPEELYARNQIGSRYSKMIDSEKIVTPYVESNRTTVYAQYSVLVKDRSGMIKKLTDAEIPTAVHYPMPLHLQEAFSFLGSQKGDFPVAERISEEIMSLPMSSFLTKKEQNFIVRYINE